MSSLLKSRFLLSLLFVLVVISCDFNNKENTDDFNSDLAELEDIKTAIEELAKSSECNENTDCFFIAFGSKPCGGPWSYLIYTNSIDVNLLETMVEEFNNKQKAFNIKHNQISDCSLAIPPVGFDCQNNTCIPLY